MLLEKVSRELGIPFEYYIFSDEKAEDIERLKKYLPLDKLRLKYIIRFKTGLKGLRILKRDILKCDLVIDLTYGDSFSDIYGFKGYLLYSIPKLISIKNRIPFILGPQTIGPFHGRTARNIARYIIDSTNYIAVRDEISSDCCHEISGDCKVQIASDLAMELPFETGASWNSRNGKQNVGLNVSLLLWDQADKFKFRFDYKEFTKELIEALMKAGACVHLVAHVYDSIPQNEYWLMNELHKQYPDTIVAPQFRNPIEAKNYLSQLDFFIGARMHATIGAFSAGVPVVPISYSRKFEGLYSAIGYPYTINCKEVSMEQAVDMVMHMLRNVSFYKQEQMRAFAKAMEMNQNYFELLKRVIRDLV